MKGMQLITEVSVELTSILDRDRLLDRIAQIVRRFINYDLFAVLLVDQARQEFACKAAVGFSDRSLQDLQRLKVHEGLVGRAVSMRSRVLVEDVRKEGDYRPLFTWDGRSPASELVLPLVIKDRVLGVMVLWSTQLAFFKEHHLQLLTPLAAHVAVAIENASLYEEKSRDALTWQVINEVAKEMTAILDLDELLGRIAVLIRRAIEYEILGIFLFRPDRDLMELKVAIGYAEETIEKWKYLPMGRGLLGNAALARKTLVSTDLANDPRAISAKTADGRWTRSEVAIPLISRHKLLGGLVVESCEPGYFEPMRVEILETLGRHMAVGIDNAQLFEQLLAKEQKLEADFALARDLQASMLPLTMPGRKGLQVGSLYKPAESLGGDYYDFMWLDDRLLAFAIGDVSGKGVAAAMTMAATRSALRFAARRDSAPSQVLFHVNRRLFRDVKKRTYISLFYGILDLGRHVCRWTNGGHLPPLLIRKDGSYVELATGGVPVALFDTSHYSTGRVQIRPGDLLFCYTDGVTEALNTNDEEFGRDRLIGALKSSAGQGAREILRHVYAELRKFTRGSRQHDDIAAFVIQFDG